MAWLKRDSIMDARAEIKSLLALKTYEPKKYEERIVLVIQKILEAELVFSGKYGEEITEEERILDGIFHNLKKYHQVIQSAKEYTLKAHNDMRFGSIDSPGTFHEDLGKAWGYLNGAVDIARIIEGSINKLLALLKKEKKEIKRKE